jgi:hypothetical protein
LWLRKLLADLEISVKTVKINADNQAAIKLLKNTATSSRSKHVDVTHHFARERVERGEVDFVYISTDGMVADALTKATPLVKLEKFRFGMGVVP